MVVHLVRFAETHARSEKEWRAVGVVRAVDDGTCCKERLDRVRCSYLVGVRVRVRVRVRVGVRVRVRVRRRRRRPSRRARRRRRRRSWRGGRGRRPAPASLRAARRAPCSWRAPVLIRVARWARRAAR